MHFKSYLLKFRKQYELLCCLPAKSRAFLRNWSVLRRHSRKGFCIENGRRWFFLCHSIVRYSRISRLQGGVEPQYWRGVRALRRGREFPWQESRRCDLRWRIWCWPPSYLVRYLAFVFISSIMEAKLMARELVGIAYIRGIALADIRGFAEL